MIINVSVAVSRLIDECNIQTSLDLQAMRSRGTEGTEAVYDDWIITKENGEEVYYALQDICSDMAFNLRTIIRTYSAGRDVVSVDIEDAHIEPNEGVVLEGLMRKHLKYALLAWWYHYRDAELSATYGTASAGSLDALFTQCLPRTGTNVGRYF
jgi:hypothetical protein